MPQGVGDTAIMNTSTIEPMAGNDVEEVSDLVVSSIRKGFAGSYAPDVIDAVARGNSIDAVRKHTPVQTDYVMRSGDLILGMIGLKRNEIGHLFVSPAQSARGVGRRLVDFARKTCRDVGHTEMIVLASLNSDGFYRRCGFTETARGSFVVGDDLQFDYVRMICKIGEGRTNVSME